MWVAKKRRICFWGVIALLGLGLAGMPLEAAEQSAAAPPDSVDALQFEAVGEMGYGMLLVKLGLGLALVVLLAWGSVHLLRKSAFGQQYSGVGNTVKVVERTFLAPRKAVYLVEVGQRVLALGVTEEQITRLAEWGAGEIEMAADRPPPASFAEQFKHIIAQKTKRGV